MFIRHSYIHDVSIFTIGVTSGKNRNIVNDTHEYTNTGLVNVPFPPLTGLVLLIHTKCEQCYA